MKSHNQNAVRRMAFPVLIGAAVGVLVCLVVLLITAAVMTAVVLPMSVVTPLTLAAAALGAFVGGLSAARLSRERGLLYGALSGLLLFLLMVTAGLIVVPDVHGALLPLKAALTIAGGALGGIIGVNLRRRRR